MSSLVARFSAAIGSSRKPRDRRRALSTRPANRLGSVEYRHACASCQRTARTCPPRRPSRRRTSRRARRRARGRSARRARPRRAAAERLVLVREAHRHARRVDARLRGEPTRQPSGSPVARAVTMNMGYSRSPTRALNVAATVVTPGTLAPVRGGGRRAPGAQQVFSQRRDAQDDAAPDQVLARDRAPKSRESSESPRLSSQHEDRPAGHARSGRRRSRPRGVVDVGLAPRPIRSTNSTPSRISTRCPPTATIRLASSSPSGASSTASSPARGALERGTPSLLAITWSPAWSVGSCSSTGSRTARRRTAAAEQRRGAGQQADHRPPPARAPDRRRPRAQAGASAVPTSHQEARRLAHPQRPRRGRTSRMPHRRAASTSMSTSTSTSTSSPAAVTMS